MGEGNGSRGPSRVMVDPNALRELEAALRRLEASEQPVERFGSPTPNSSESPAVAELQARIAMLEHSAKLVQEMAEKQVVAALNAQKKAEERAIELAKKIRCTPEQLELVGEVLSVVEDFITTEPPRQHQWHAVKDALRRWQELDRPLAQTE